MSRSSRNTSRVAALRAGSLVLTVGLVVACSSSDPQDGGPSAQVATSSSTPRATESPGGAGQVAPGEASPIPNEPADRPGALARQLDLAVSTLADRQASARQVRQAGQLHQLAVRQVATKRASFRQKVIDRLERTTARATVPAIRAARELQDLVTPQPKLPRWRIVAPPPPPELRRHYLRAQRRTGVPWTYLAAIHLVETRMGRIRGTSSAGAKGPMQFLPTTWELYGAGGDINDPQDAILAAGRLLRRHGAPEDMAGALWHYNPSGYYVRAVSAYARTMQRATYLYRGYWHWRVLYRHERGTYVLPVGYPQTRARLLRDG